MYEVDKEVKVKLIKMLQQMSFQHEGDVEIQIIPVSTFDHQ